MTVFSTRSQAPRTVRSVDADRRDAQSTGPSAKHPRLRRTARVLAAAFATSTLSIAPVAAAHPAAGAAGSFIPAYEYFDRAPGNALLGNSGFQEAVSALEGQFDAICGDTFCEGDYSNLRSVGLDCSIAETSGTVGQCTWTFAGSYTDADPATGRLTVNAKTFVCDLGVQGTATELARFLTAASNKGAGGAYGLFTVAVPGSGKSLQDALICCL